MSLMQNYCGANLLCSRSFGESTYMRVRLVPSLSCAVHIGLLMTFCKRLI